MNLSFWNLFDYSNINSQLDQILICSFIFLHRMHHCFQSESSNFETTNSIIKLNSNSTKNLNIEHLLPLEYLFQNVYKHCYKWMVLWFCQNVTCYDDFRLYFKKTLSHNVYESSFNQFFYLHHFVHHCCRTIVKMSHISAISLFVLTKNIYNNFKSTFDIVTPFRYLSFASLFVLELKKFIIFVIFISLLLSLHYSYICRYITQKYRHFNTKDYQNKFHLAITSHLYLLLNNYYCKFSDNNWFSLIKGKHFILLKIVSFIAII